MRRRVRIVVGFLLVLAAGATGLELAIRSTPLPPGIDQPPPDTPALRDVRGRIFFIVPTDTARESLPLPLREMGRWLPLATVAIEDHRFPTHGGVDFHALFGAAWRNARHGKVISGASTITQQLVKNTSHPRHRTLSVKIYESLAAARLERIWNKKKILEAYMNRLDYGNRRIGPVAAARAYFGKSPADLSLAEAIYLAGLPQSPMRLNPWKNPSGALTRYQHNVSRLAAMGLLPDGVDVVSLRNHPPQIEQHDPPVQAVQFAGMVLKSSSTQTTLDLDLQQVAERLLREHLADVGPQGVGDAAVVIVENATGNVRALACAGKRQHSAINSALEPRSCGSTLKPFLYLAAIDHRQMTAATILPDTPDAITDEYRDYDPQNYSNRYHGPVRLREALGNSMNVPAVVTLSKIGARDTFNKLGQWGLNFPQSFDDYGAGFILGNARVCLLDLAGAYAGLARSGEAWSPRITPRDAIESRIVASPEASAIITDILCDNTARALSFGTASPLHLEQRTAVKTGTSSGFRDGWCVGFNGRHTVAVWAGNLDGKPMGELLAVRSAAPLWASLMRHLYTLGDQPVPTPVETSGLRCVVIATETGLLPRPGEPVLNEWFLAGTEPTKNAADQYANATLQLPQEYAAWCASPQNHLRARAGGGLLKIVFPRDGAVFELNPYLAPGKQMVHLTASEKNCEWQINNGPRQPAEDGPRVMMEKGEWVVRAFRGDQVAETRFRVE